MTLPPDEDAKQVMPKISADYAEKTARALMSALRLQTVVAIVLALGLLVVGPVAAYSSMCGSLTVYLPGMLFTVLLARKIGGSSTSFLGIAALAEFGKLFLMAVLCALVFIWVKPLEPTWFFAGMFIVLITSWFGLAMAIR